MRIGVDATCWANSRGYGRFTRHLIPAMATLAPQHTFICFVDQHSADRFDVPLPNVEAKIVRVDESPTTAAASDRSRSLLDMLRLSWAVARTPLHVFFSPSVYTYFPLPPGLRVVVTVHDTIVERFPQLTMPGIRARSYWWLKMRLALSQARLVLTVSDFAAADIASVLRVETDRIRVAVEAPAPVYSVGCTQEEIAQAAASLGLAPGVRWLVYVGGFNPHKNVATLVHAHAALVRRMGTDAPHLLLVGTVTGDVFHGNLAQIRHVIEQEHTGNFVHWTGFLEDKVLRLVHAGALALVLPSACEGFGLPAVEAAACGTPVVATTESPLPQLLAGGGLFVRPDDRHALINALHTITTDETARLAMGTRARKCASELSWDRCARATLSALHEAA